MLVKAVVDTNVWVSAAQNPVGTPRRIAEAFEADLFVMVYSNKMIAELVRVLARPKFAGKIDVDQAGRFVALIKRTAVFVQATDIPTTSRDPKDDVFLACSLASNADYLVTGDKDLLTLKEYGNTKIVTPAEFLEVLAQ